MASDGRRANQSPQGGRAVCTRCGGLLVTEHYLDLHYDTGQIDFIALRCASCGEVIDPVILKNREASPPNLLYGSKARKFSQPVKDRSEEKRDRNADGGEQTAWRAAHPEDWWTGIPDAWRGPLDAES